MAKKISDDNMFFGFNLTDEQKEFRDAIYSGDYDITFVNSKSGCGKTFIAIATSKLLVSLGQFDGLVYIFSGVEERNFGYRPGTQEEKERDYLQPLFDALIDINEQPEKALISSNLNEMKKKSIGWVETFSHTFTRGMNIKNKVVVIDEAQNWTVEQLKKILTRCHKSCRIVVIGHTGQIDLPIKEQSGFQRYIEHFRDKERAKICNLTKNFRGWVAQWADELK
jgi:predicted ribonuclease YlaK